MSDIIGEYAKLAVLREQIEGKGLRPPSKLLERMQHIETLARARLTPEQFNAALNHVEHAKLHFRQELAAETQAGEAARMQARKDQITQQLSAGIAGHERGLTREQLQTIAKGKPLDPPKRITQKERDAAFRERTKALDPSGKGWTEAEYERRMDALADADPKQFEAMAKGYRADAKGLRQAVTNWKAERIEYGLQKRRQASDEFHGLSGAPREPNERDRRRAVLVDAFLDHSADAIEQDTLRGRRSPVLAELEDRKYERVIYETNADGSRPRRSHIAEAMAEVEDRGDIT